MFEIVLDMGSDLPHIPPDTMTGKQLRTLRLAHGLRQEDLAAEIGVSRMAVTMWENSKRPLSLRNFKAVRTALENIKSRREAKTA